MGTTFEEILARLSRATGGTWSIEPHGQCPHCEGKGHVSHGQSGPYPCGVCRQTGHNWVLYSDRFSNMHGLNLVTLSDWDRNMDANMDLISHARQDLDFLVRMVQTLEARIKALEDKEEN